MSKLLEFANKYNYNSFIDAANYLDEKGLKDIFDKQFLYGVTHIYPHDLKKRKDRDSFFAEVLNFCQFKGFVNLNRHLFIKVNLFHRAEEQFDEIKGSISDSALNQLPVEDQFWAQLVCIEKEIIKITSLLQRQIKQMAKRDGGLLVAQRHRINLNGVDVDPDFQIEQLICALSLSTILYGHKNSLFDVKSGELIIKAPTQAKSNFDTIPDIAEMPNLATAWRKLEDTSARCVLFGGQAYVRKGSELAREEIDFGFNCISHFEPHFSDFEVYDFISQRRNLDRQSQNFFELVLDPQFKALVVENISDLREGLFLSENEMNCLNSLSDYYCTDIFSSDKQYHGLTIKEWVRGYFCLIYLTKNVETKKDFCIFSYDKILHILKLGGIVKNKALTFIKLVTFGKGSRDIYDTPLIKLDNGTFFLPDIILSKGFSVLNILLSRFSSLEVVVGSKGEDFERKILKKLRDEGIQSKSFKFKRGKDEYEYDTVFLLDNKVFVVECKNRSLSGWSPVRGARFKKFIDETVLQVKRLVNGLKQYPEVLKEHFGLELSEVKLIPVIMNAQPFSYKGKYRGVYISDYSSFAHFISKGNVVFSESNKQGSSGHEQTELLRLWEGDAPNSTDLLNHMNNPIHLKVYTNNIEKLRCGIITSNKSGFIIEQLDADQKKGLSLLFKDKLSSSLLNH
ncbi:hypothetical protein AN214_03527 [Pseudoalteromonas sp. P1-9]|uniref:nuclease-related domain-containing protein n=1 Tax=Pseudoalteromonas sp. P1-9 TaxID=1710354 RepID=UPI0006D6051F|nr:nuclease-related domain-containing protein [Pseudoalteromonas sp. P1-9]KPV94429.1 hypothetical protein AN214_03527 [Pseudoalteromonas sp. P1-9]